MKNRVHSESILGCCIWFGVLFFFTLITFMQALCESPASTIANSFNSCNLEIHLWLLLCCSPQTKRNHTTSSWLILCNHGNQNLLGGPVHSNDNLSHSIV